MRFFKRKKHEEPAPEQTPAQHLEDALAEQLKMLREQFLCVRDDDGTWTAYHKDPVKGSWFVWRRLRHVPELRAERPIRPPAEPTIHPDQATWDVPDTFPDDWKLDTGNEYGSADA